MAYDWRDRHVPTFEEEILQYKKRGIEYFAFWDVHEDAFKLFEKHGLHPQIWKMMGDPQGTTQDNRVIAAAEQCCLWSSGRENLAANLDCTTTVGGVASRETWSLSASTCEPTTGRIMLVS